MGLLVSASSTEYRVQHSVINSGSELPAELWSSNITLDTYLRIIIARTIHSPAIWVPKQLANNGVALLELFCLYDLPDTHPRWLLLS